jgi:D-alanyl-lipoteichoic acid acyltransferase DltB (MBOAT superfamily)
MGVATPENFNRPLLARNLIDFWERWHISLSLFIRRNVFIPLQLFLMRRNDGRSPLASALAAIAISFVLCGLWHGLGLGFLIWGAVQAAGLVVARVYGHLLQARLGRAGVQRYLTNPWFRAAGIVMTFEVQAIALLALMKA